MDKRTAKRVTAQEIKGITKIAQQHMVNATLLDVANYGLDFSAMELQVAIDALTRLHARVVACAAVEKASAR